MPNPLKPIQSLISTKKENTTLYTLNGSNLTYTLCDRTDLASSEANYFSSFNLPALKGDFLSGSTLALNHPELLQLNVDKVIIAPIPRVSYAESIDGRSVTMTIPQASNVELSAKTIVSSTYGSLNKSQNNALLGSNIAFLFSDDINLPYTGSTESGAFDKSLNTTWNTTKFIDRPAAVSYIDIETLDVNSDTRPWTGVNLSYDIEENYPTLTNQGMNYDVPVGFMSLDKGFMIITHPDIVNNFDWNKGHHASTGVANTGVSSGTTDIYFTATTASQVTYYDLDTVYKTAYVCLALPGEFYMSNNPTWDLQKNLNEKSAGTNNYDDIYITEIGLYNVQNELIAIAKLDQPVLKTVINLMTFTLEIDV